MVSEPDHRATSASIVKRGKQLYDDRLKGLLEPEHIGKYIVIDVETGEYEIDRNHRAASDRAVAKRPGAPLYATRVGYPTLGRIGRMP